MSNTTTKADQKEGSPKEPKSRESSKPADDEKSKPEKTTAEHRKKNSNSPQEGAQQQQQKKVMKTGVTGVVKWFNVVNRYGFISRDDIAGEDIFVHQTAIASFNPKKAVASLGDGEKVVFDVVEGEYGPEALHVTGPQGEPVHGSKHAPDKLSVGIKRGFYRRGYRRRGGARSSSGGEGDVEDEENPQYDEAEKAMWRGRGFRRFGFRGANFRPRPPRENNDESRFEGGGDTNRPPRRGTRGRGGRGAGRGGRRPQLDG